MTTAWCIEIPAQGTRSEQLWPDRDSACRWASREMGPGPWHAVEVPAFELPLRGLPFERELRELHHMLSELDLITLDILAGLKPFARAEEMERWGCGDYKLLATGGKLFRMGFYSVNRAGAITPNRERIAFALRQHTRPVNVRDKYGYRYSPQGLNPFKPSEP